MKSDTECQSPWQSALDLGAITHRLQGRQLIERENRYSEVAKKDRWACRWSLNHRRELKWIHLIWSMQASSVHWNCPFHLLTRSIHCTPGEATHSELKIHNVKSSLARLDEGRQQQRRSQTSPTERLPRRRVRAQFHNVTQSCIYTIASAFNSEYEETDRYPPMHRLKFEGNLSDTSKRWIAEKESRRVLQTQRTGLLAKRRSAQVADSVSLYRQTDKSLFLLRPKRTFHFSRHLVSTSLISYI